MSKVVNFRDKISKRWKSAYSFEMTRQFRKELATELTCLRLFQPPESNGYNLPQPECSFHDPLAGNYNTVLAKLCFHSFQFSYKKNQFFRQTIWKPLTPWVLTEFFSPATTCQIKVDIWHCEKKPFENTNQAVNLGRISLAIEKLLKWLHSVF